MPAFDVFDLVGFPYPPDSLEEACALAYLFAFFDESGKYKDHPIVSFSGLVEGADRWQLFTDKWVQLLRAYEIPRIHAVKALRHSQPFGNMKKGTAKERSEKVIPFINEIANLSLAIAVSVDVHAHAKVKELHKQYTPDPHYFAFYMAINLILTHFSIPKPFTIGLICHDEQQKAIRCYELLKNLKREVPEARRVTSICFSDDRDSPQLQASDLFAYLSRLEAQRIFAGRPYPYESLFNLLGQVMPSGGHLCMRATYFSEDSLRKVAAEQIIGRIVFGKPQSSPQPPKPLTSQ
jgi:Protein of unknown function (DUF3800)